MARNQFRSKVGVVTTTLGLAVLLAGPTATLGLGVPTVESTTTQVTSTVQGTVQTTEQTAATTVTQVESTVQSTVQATQQVATTQPPATAPAPAAPTQTVTRVSAPVKKAATRVARPAAPAKQVSTNVAKAQQQVNSTAGATRTAVTKRTTAARAHKVAATAPGTYSRATDEPASQCDIPLLAVVPGGDELRGLLALACDAAGGVDLPSALGLTPQADALAALATPGPGTSSTPAPDPRRARAAGLRTHRATGAGTPAAANAAAATRPGGVVAGIHAAAGGHAGALAYVDGVNAAHVASASSHGAGATDAGRHHHTWFSGQSRGSEILLALIFASLSLLVGITLWRLAARWVIPRFV